MLHPRNIVLVGATDKPGNYAERIWNNLIKYGYEGGLFPVNAKRETIWGVPCYKDFASLPENPDHVLVLVPARFAVQVIRDAAAAGARSATIVTSGFSELQDEESQRLAVELKQAVKETGLAVTGPNCLGNLSAGEKLFTNIDDRIVTMEAGPVAIVGQSGAIVMAIRQTLEDRGVGVGYMVTTGNETGLETPDLMTYFAADPSIRVIVVYLEGVRNTKVFREACKAARAAGKPVIALKLGASEGGRAAAMAHTGALAGSIETFDAISTREGVIRVRGLDELIETTECFVHADLPKGNRLAAVSLSGGKRGLLIDAFYSAGMNFAPLSPNATAQLAQMLGPGSIVGNPLDAGFAAVVDPSVYIKSIKIMIDDPDTDIVIIDAELPKAPHELRERNLRLVNEMAGTANKPVVYISAMSIGFTEFTKALRKSLPNIAVMQGLDRAVGAIKSLIEYASLRKEVPDIVSSSKASARAMLERTLKAANGARRAGRGRVEETAKSLRHPGFEGRDCADRGGSRQDRQEDRLPRRRKGGQRRHPAQVGHRRRGAEPQQRRGGEEGVQRHHHAGEEDQEQAEAGGHSDRAAGQGRSRTRGRRLARRRDGSRRAVRHRRR
ncbi:acyl-CoA synthetase (NDP forming) [Bradyrhizobium sp. AZCC 1719]